MGGSRFLSLYVDGRCADCGRHISPPSRVFGECPGCSFDRAAAQKDATAHQLPITPAGRFYVANALAEGVTVVDPDTGEERHTGPLISPSGWLAIVEGGHPPAPRGTWS